jgi:purine-binding chemotaxis protein CheW
MGQPDTTLSDVAQGDVAVLMFLLAGRQFAVELNRVQHILEYQAPIKTPRRPPFVEGIMQHKGRFLPVVSLRKRLGVEGPAPLHPAILLLAGIGPDSVVGVMVDQVLRVLSLPGQSVLTPPPRMLGIRAEFIRGVANAGGRPVVWLDEAKLLTSDEPITLLV